MPDSPETAVTWQHHSSHRGLEDPLKRLASERHLLSRAKTQVPGQDDIKQGYKGNELEN